MQNIYRKQQAWHINKLVLVYEAGGVNWKLHECVPVTGGHECEVLIY